jgi:single-strand DNA-binding protein
VWRDCSIQQFEALIPKHNTLYPEQVMATLNKVMLIGRLTDDPEAPRVLPNTGNKVVKFRFAVSRNRKNPNTGQWENDPNPLFIDCEAFSRGDNSRVADLITQYTRKGSQIYIEGRLQLDQWEDRQSGQKRSKHKVVVDAIQFLDTRGGSEEGGEFRGGSRPMSAPARSGPDNYDDVGDSRSGSPDDENPPF